MCARYQSFVHFTLWPSAHSKAGGHIEIDWPDFLGFLASPQVVTDINALEGWSPVKFAGNRRNIASVEAVSCIVLDDDSSGLALDHVTMIWQGVAGAIHSSRRHTAAAPRWRIVLRCSRDMTATEHAIVWRFVRDVAAGRGQVLDEATKDPSRLWFVPAHLEGAPYEWFDLAGAPLDVEAILAAGIPDGSHRVERLAAAPAATPAAEPGRPNAPVKGSDGRRQAMAAALGAAWPPKGRHAAQLALAGALRGEGFTEAEALEFLCDVCRAAGDEDRPKRATTVRHTFARPPDAPLTGWTRLKAHVDPVVVDAARGALSRDAEGLEMMTRRLSEVAAARSSEPACPENVDTWGAFDWSTIDPPLVWRVDGIIQEATVNLAFGAPNSLKTWTMYLMAAAVAKGEPWLGRSVVQGPVFILDYESSPRQARRRMRVLGQSGIANLRYVNPVEMLDNLELWARLARVKPAMIVVDSLSRGMLGRDENDQKSATVPFDIAKRLARECGTATTFIHHKNKSGAEGFESARGSVAIAAAAEGWLEFVNFEALDGGAQRVTLQCARLKESVPFEPIMLELSDLKGLVEVKGAIKQEKKEGNRERILRILAPFSTGMPRKQLFDQLVGTTDTRNRDIAEALTAGLIREYDQPSGGRGRATGYLELDPLTRCVK